MLIATLGLLLFPCAGPFADEEAPDLVAREVMAKLETGVDATDLERVQTALEWNFEHPALLESAANLALKLDDKDLAFWYASLAAEAASSAGDSSATKRLDAFLATHAPEGANPADVFNEYAEDLFKLAQDCKTKKLYANAAEVLLRCRGTRFEARAESLLGSLFKQKKATDAIFRSGIDIPEKPATKKDPKWIAEWDGKHSEWKDVEAIKGKGYIIETNMGYEMAHKLADTMEQMGEFYNDFFKIRKKMKPCTIRIYATREELNDHEEHGGPNTLGWFQPWDNTVVSFDPRSTDRPLAGLWGTLFHEAAHQYTRSIASAVIPGWFSEGTACYFEGARLLPSGAVITNQIPESRLRSLVLLLDHRPEWGLKGCVTYFEPGSYAGEYYPFGWGLTYYLFNYENEESERIYRPFFEEYQELYTKEKSHNPFDRFVEFFITKPKVPGVTDFATFDLHWQEWIRDLHSIYFGPEEKADVLVERALKQQENGKPEYAIESLRWAVDKRPTDIHIRLLLAQALDDAKGQEDGATHSYRRAMEMARRFDGDRIAGVDQTPAEVQAFCLDRIGRISKNVGGGLAKGDAELIDGTRRVATAFVEANCPRSALYLVRTAVKVLDGHRELDQLAKSLIAEHEIDPSRRRRLRVEPDLPMWIADDGMSAGGGGKLVAEPEKGSIASAAYREEPEGPYRIEASVTLEEASEMAGIGVTFGGNEETGELYLLMIPKLGVTIVLALGEEKMEERGVIPGAPELEVGEARRIALEVDGKLIRFFVDDEELGSLELPTERETRGRIGFAAQSCKAVFSDLTMKF